MSKRWAVILGGMCVVFMGVPAAVQAQYPSAFWMDDFEDGQLFSPPPFDPCDPCWIEKLIMSDSWAFGIDNGRLRMTTISIAIRFTAYAGMVSDYPPSFDPNVGGFNNSDPHWHLLNARTHDDNYTPFTGLTGIWIHADMITDLRGYNLLWEPQDSYIGVLTFKGFTYRDALGNAYRTDWDYPQVLVDPNNHNGQSLLRDPRVPIWILAQYDPNGTHHDPNYPNDPNDPNCHWIRAAAWVGAKDDWNGYWAVHANLLKELYPGAEMTDAVTDTTFPFDPNTMTDLYVHTFGHQALLSYGGGDTYDPNLGGGAGGAVCDASYDDIENFWGYAKDTYSWTLTLTVKNAGMGEVIVTPNQPSYANGTVVTLDAVPNSGKSLKYWKVFHRARLPDDANYATESNDPQLVLIMDGDHVVEAKFKCGSSEMLPPIGMVLLVLTSGLVIRRRLL